MTDNNNIQSDDEMIRQLMQSAKQQAPENLKHRIMHQIETESTLACKAVPAKKQQGNVLKDFIGIFGVMYVVLAALIGGAYMLKGKDFLFSSAFIGMAVVVASVFSLFWLMTRLDARLKSRRRKTPTL